MIKKKGVNMLLYKVRKCATDIYMYAHDQISFAP